MGSEAPENPSERHHSGNRNVTLFILFRVFFNARFYYPIFAILFIDFGLTWTEFYLLNMAWAIASILLEVPSGALADQFGRRTLVICAAVLMVLEMAIICFTPMGGGALVFTLFLFNRILSGAAEAAASGADEALAYDSIPEAERESLWPKIQSRLMIVQAIGMIIAFVIGSAGYSLNQILEFAGSELRFDKEITTRIPLFLCLGSSLATLLVTLLMREPERETPREVGESSIRASFRETFEAGRWILDNRAPFYILLIFVLFDSVVRLFYTVGSSYYRMIEIDPVFFGLIGVGGNLAGMMYATLIGKMVGTRSASFNYRVCAIAMLSGLGLLALQIPIWGVLVLIPLGFGMRAIHVATSQYLNRVTDSRHRATVLSFRGLAMMVAYGGINVVAILQIRLTGSGASSDTVWDAMAADEVIRQTSPWWWVWFVVILVFLEAWRRIRYGRPVDEIIRRAEER